jgi:DNA-binding transcriptional LysR family regulator
MARINIDTQLLRSFITIVDAGGFARAADLLHMTQPAISQQMRRLEEMLGQVLFERSGRKMQLSPKGELLLGYARQIIDLNDQLASRMRVEKSRELVRLGMPEHVSDTILPHIIAAVTRTFPQVQLVIRIATSDLLLQGIEQGEIDLALTFNEKGTSATPILQEVPVAWMAGSRFDLRPSGTIPLILFSGQCMFRKLIIQSLDSVSRPWFCAYESGDLVSLRAAVRANLGITALPHIQTYPDLRIVTEEELLPSLPTSQVTLRRRPAWLSAAAEEIGLLVTETWEACMKAGAEHRPEPSALGIEYRWTPTTAAG